MKRARLLICLVLVLGLEPPALLRRQCEAQNQLTTTSGQPSDLAGTLNEATR